MGFNSVFKGLTVSTHTSAVERECCILFMLAQKVLSIRSSKTALLNIRIATLTKMQHIYCMRFTKETLSFIPRLLAPTVGNVRFSRLQGNEFRCMSALLNSSYKVWICYQFSLTLCILFLAEIVFKSNLKNELEFSTLLINRCLSGTQMTVP